VTLSEADGSSASTVTLYLDRIYVRVNRALLDLRIYDVGRPYNARLGEELVRALVVQAAEGLGLPPPSVDTFG
jgi:hypothetical protein